VVETRYRCRTKNPDLGDTFEQALPTLAVGQRDAEGPLS
jgi:hypothetical protein